MELIEEYKKANQPIRDAAKSENKKNNEESPYVDIESLETMAKDSKISQ
jgi:hypothetical protein